MNVNDFMAKHDITDADLNRTTAPYEDGSFEIEPDVAVFSGSHLDASAKTEDLTCKEADVSSSSHRPVRVVSDKA